MKRYSLTIRLALLFALLSFFVLSLMGITLYRGLERQLMSRDNAALVEHVARIRALLQDPDTMRLLDEKPHIFEKMLGNHDALLIIGFPGQPPLIRINQNHMALPDFQPVAEGAILSSSAVHRSMEATGTPFIAMAATVRPHESSREIEIIVGRMTNDSALFLKNCRDRILIQISLAALLFALAGYWLMRRGLLPLRRLVTQTETITVANLTARIDGTGAPKELSPVIDSFNAMLVRLGSGFARLSQVSADMAHDLRTPINNLLGQTEVALGQPRTADHYESLLASNLEELQRLSKMTDSMLFLARSENADIEIERKRLDVSAELQCVAEYFEGLAEERELNIVVKGEESVFADPMLLRRALANLTANAVQYADQGTTILLQSRNVADGTKLVVENRGPMIDEPHLTRLFDRFYRADASRRGSADASGLGLSIVRTIMMLHQGAWDVSSAEGVTRFTLFFPGKKEV